MPTLKEPGDQVGRRRQPATGVQTAGPTTKEHRMAEEKTEPREINFRQLLPWTELFRGFQVALDPKKLLLAAAGILITAFWWSLWSWFAYGLSSKPDWATGKYTDRQDREQGWRD